MLLENALVHYYDQVRHALRQLLLENGSEPGDEFSPGAELPELTAPMREYLSASDLVHSPMANYRGKDLALMDLGRNPATMTTKIFPSLIIVARAVRYIQDTGQPVTIITPSSANKATGLRDAVLRAITCGLVSPDQLNIVSIVPVGSVSKLRVSELFTDPALRARNPIVLYPGKVPGEVKIIARGVIEQHGESIAAKTKTRLWYTMRLENYMAADVIRPLAEAEFFPASPGRPRLQAQAVSSAFGLLGYAYGRTAFQDLTGAAPEARYFLVQHLGAPDMVLSLNHGGIVDERQIPAYSYSADTGLYTQHESENFPAVTFDPRETLDTTFYTRNPPTSARMNELIHGQGGGGIVVSLAECLERYGQARAMLSSAGMRIPASPMAVREWSSIMATVGILNAIDRNLVPEDDVLIHGSGTYAADDFECLTPRDLYSAEDADELQALVLQATLS